MSEQPLVCCVMLTRDRPEMAKRAVECFRRQTYENKRLLIYCTGSNPYASPWSFEDKQINHIWEYPSTQCTVGRLRNTINSWTDGDILCHFDDDDYSHSNRLAEQVMLLQASGADCVGYSDMLFWRDCRNPLFPGDPSTCQVDPCFCLDSECGQAWLYLGPQKALGTSLCYWRATWERKPFPDQPRPGHASGEDTDWIKGLNLVTATSLHHASALELPRMIASIHGANTSGSYKLIGNSTSWMRVPEFDNYCRERMAL